MGGAPCKTVHHILYNCPKMSVDVSAAKKLGPVRELDTGPGLRGRGHEATPVPLGTALPVR